jgi:hypothetical protein
VTAAAVVLAALAGLAGSVQVAVKGRFGGRIGVLEASTFATAVQLLLAASILLLARQAWAASRAASTFPSGCGPAA